MSHANKATKGALARSLLCGSGSVRTVPALLEWLRGTRWLVDLSPDGVLDVLEPTAAASARPVG